MNRHSFPAAVLAGLLLIGLAASAQASNGVSYGYGMRDLYQPQAGDLAFTYTRTCQPGQLAEAVGHYRHRFMRELKTNRNIRDVFVLTNESREQIFVVSLADPTQARDAGHGPGLEQAIGHLTARPVEKGLYRVQFVNDESRYEPRTGDQVAVWKRTYATEDNYRRALSHYGDIVRAVLATDAHARDTILLVNDKARETVALTFFRGGFTRTARMQDQEVLRELSREGVITAPVFYTLAAIGNE